ncbi:uncharacterized protein [Rutidosis leptorrhynchoides]|uniref:uncharacterized protein n=1 Tax=Rutidosis leptorrhynchoides TaxID=125765 RepID=UPI003A998626
MLVFEYIKIEYVLKSSFLKLKCLKDSLKFNVFLSHLQFDVAELFGEVITEAKSSLDLDSVGSFFAFIKTTAVKHVHEIVVADVEDTYCSRVDVCEYELSNTSKVDRFIFYSFDLEPQVFESSRPNKEVDPNFFERDPGKREQIWSYPADKREHVRRFYLSQGPYQISLDEYPTKVRIGDGTFIVKGFDKWKKVNDGNRCAFLKHMNCSQHKKALISSENLLNQAGHIENIFEKQRSEVALTCAFRGHDESANSSNRGNFLELLKLLASYNDDVAKVVLENAPYNSRLQLALVAASREVIPVHQFFEKLTFLINVICASSKRHDELQKAKAIETERLLELGEIETVKGANQAGTLKRAGDTSWGSHYSPVCSLLAMFNATRVVLKGIIDEGSCSHQRGDADTAYCYTTSFEFVLILHLMKEILGKTEFLSQALQKKSQDIINAMDLVAATKEYFNELRNNGWESLLSRVKILCEKHDGNPYFHE